ncbi:MAG: ACP S-malonyltransferase [Puniceicoccales bacterium]|jgi:[acyl-carrier-protein] S-malonyltransferase|nr:ACP S-malonyltransferase [Puniceicoccales bacterium]
MGTALVFPGQGAQYVGMGLSLYENSPAAKKIFSRAEEILGGAFLQACFRGPEEVLTQTSVCQPALFTHGCAAVEILREKIPEKKYSIAYGLSLGELTALCIAEVFDFTTGVKLVAERGRLMRKACEETDGAMLCLIGGNPDDATELCSAADVEMANMNCPGQIVVSGEMRNIKKAMEMAQKMAFKRVLPLNVAGAYHSRLMESAAQGFEKFLHGVELQPPKIKILSNVTGALVESPGEIKKLLARQIISPVLFEKCCHSALQLEISEFFECGPGRTLSGMMRKISGNVTLRNFDGAADFNDLLQV